MSHFVIVGASLTGAKAAAQLRADGFDGRISLIGEETSAPYERPSLSKDYLRGDDELPTLVHPEAFYSEHQIELRLGRQATGLNAERRELTLASGESVGYDRLLLATGASPRRLAVPGADLDGVLYLRTVADADALRAQLNAAKSVVIVGAGWIGSEVAASARQMGCEVTVIEPQSAPLERVLGTEVGGFYARAHAAHGVRLLLSQTVTAIQAAGARRRVLTSGGEAIECDLVVAGVGVIPRDELATAAGLGVANGVLVDDQLKTSIGSVFAAGDVASVAHPRYGRLRVEHWANAADQGVAAAQSMLDQPVAWDKLPYFFSDQYDIGMEYRGHTPDGFDKVALRGDPDSGAFLAFWLKDQVIQAAMNVNVWDYPTELEALVASRAPVAAERLSDESVALDSLVAEPKPV